MQIGRKSQWLKGAGLISLLGFMLGIARADEISPPPGYSEPGTSAPLNILPKAGKSANGTQAGEGITAAASAKDTTSPSRSGETASGPGTEGYSASDLPPVEGAGKGDSEEPASLRGSSAAGEAPLDLGVTPGDQAPQDDTAADTSDTDTSEAGAPEGSASQSDAATDSAGLNPEAEAMPAEGEAPPGGIVAVLRGLDKITARVSVIDAPIDKPVMFGKLRIVARYCYKRPPTETPEVTAFLQIDDTREIAADASRADGAGNVKKASLKLAEDNGETPTGRIFSGWMFSSSPALNPLEHPVYDVWLVDCKTASPESDFGSVPNTPRVREDETKRSR